MRKMFSFDDYMLEMISEAVKNDELRLVISDTLRKYLVEIDHPIAKDIVETSDVSNKEYKVTYIDIDDSEPDKKDMISFMNSNKAIDALMKDKNIKKDDVMSDTQLVTIKNQVYNKSDKFFFNQKNRSKTKIGRIVGKLFPDKYKQSGDPGNDIESFVNIYKAARDTTNFEIVSGSDIQQWYNEKQYMPGGGSMNNSCMRYDYCSDYLDFYSDNEDKVSLVILKDAGDETKIRGRAILWQLDDPSGRTFMDRIYTVNDSDVILFQEYAKENGWLHKKYQNMSEDGPWVDTKNGEELYNNLIIKDLDDPGDGNYPYMDTMKYFDGSWLSNDKGEIDGDEVKKLEDTSGGFENEGYWSDFYNDYIDIDGDGIIHCDRYDGDDGYRYEDDCFYSDYYNESICNNYAERNMTELDHYDDNWDRYRDYGDYITTHEGNTCDEDYASNNFAYSEYHDEYLEESENSDYHDGPIAEDEAVEVYTDVEGVDTDWRIDNSDGHWWKWDHDGEKYDDDITEEELREHHGLDEDDEDDEDDEEEEIDD